MDEMEKLANKLRNNLTGPHDFIPTIGGRGERHLHGLVGNLWRIKTPETVDIGHCFLKGRLKKNDLFLCVRHSGDCFQDYIYVQEYSNCLIGKPEWNFGSYGIGDSEKVNLNSGEFEILKNGGRVER